MTALIHMLNTLAYSVRLAGVRTRRLAISLSLFSLMFLLASAANTVQAPRLSSIVELSVNRALALSPTPLAVGQLVRQPFYRGQLALLTRDIRLVIMAATAGTATILAATIVDPTAAVITDQALRGQCPERDVRSTAAFLALTRLLGTVLAQLLFVPAAWLIRWVTGLIV